MFNLPYTLITEHQLELTDKLLGLPDSKKFPMWVLEGHRCPICRKVVTDYDEIHFLNEFGECFRCDHVRGDFI